MSKKKSQQDAVAQCHCGETRDYDDCCGPFLSGAARPKRAEQLMRSRYSAFVENNAAYLLATWDPQTRPSRVTLEPNQRWLGLVVKSTQAGASDDCAGFVEFVARYKRGGKGYRLHECSRFRKIGEQWYYSDGEHL